MLLFENVNPVAIRENKYVLCASDKANDLYQSSIDSLTGSECSEYMMYDLQSANKEDLDDYNAVGDYY